MSSELPLVPSFIARFIESWAAKRAPQASDQTTLVRQRIYILPTRHGLTFFIILLVILFGAINYENSLAFMLTFLLGSIGSLGMLYTHENLNHLNIKALKAKPVFAGQQALFPISLSNAKKNTYYNLKFQSIDQHIVNASIAEDETDSTLLLPVTAHKRGRLDIQKIKVFTEFPLGLFHAWSWIELNTNCIVYPAPDLHAPHLSYQGELQGTRASESIGSDDFAGIREYQRGDAPNHLAWKAIAKTDQLQTKQFHADAGQEIWLSWYQLSDRLSTEKRLSILTRWILDADKQGISYGLETPEVSIAPTTGLHHRHACLKSLALYGAGD